MRTSLTFLTLLAAAGSAVAAPVPASNGGNGAVQKIVSGHHRRSDSTVNIDMKEHLTDRKSYKSSQSQMTKEYKDTEKEVKSDKHAVKAATKNVENRRSRSSKRATVSLFPDQDPGSKAGLADAHMKDADAHLIQTPGKDKTIVDVKSGDMDAKVNMPKDTPAPVKDASKPVTNGSATKSDAKPQNEGEQLFRGNGVSLNGKKGPLDGIANDGKGGPQGLEVTLPDNRQQNSPSPSPSAKAQPSSSPKPSPSAAPRSSSASKSKPAPTGSASAARTPPSSSPSASPKPKASPKPSPAAESHASCPPCAAPSSAGPQAQSQSQSKPAPSNSKSDPIAHVENKNDMDIAIAKPNVLTGLGKNQNLNSKPAKIDFGNMPKNTVPCDGIMVRDKGDIVDMCMKAELLEQRPKNYHACPEYQQHELHSHYDGKNDELSKQVQDYVRLCMGAGAL